ncbi:MAG: hypothetical protein AAGD28_01110 [Bacteroidota bacterium]
MKYLLLCFLFLVCLAPPTSRAMLVEVQEVYIFSQDPVKEKKKKAAPKKCPAVKPLAKRKSKTGGKPSRRRGNMGNSGGRGNMYFARNNP